MCPMCWTAALASFAGLSAVSMSAVAVRDKWILVVAIATGILTMLRRWNYLEVSWWCFILLLALILTRFALLATRRRDRLLVGATWLRARDVAKKSCHKSLVG
jgi:hypothetical protein